MEKCLLEEIETTSLKVVNLLKLGEITQGPDENPAAFLNRLTEALTTYTRIAQFSGRGYYPSQPFYIPISSRHQKKLSKADDGPQTPGKNGL